MNGLLRQALVLGFWMAALEPQANACSTFMIRQNGTLLVGHNLDDPGSGRQPGLLVVNKRGVPKEARTWSDLGRDTIPAGRLRWVSKYGSITTNTLALELPDGGINEAGLVVCEMTLVETRFVDDDRLPQMFMVHGEKGHPHRSFPTGLPELWSSASIQSPHDLVRGVLGFGDKDPIRCHDWPRVARPQIDPPQRLQRRRVDPIGPRCPGGRKPVT
jgi:hypothetical protein